ncbi:Mg2+ transporter MgtC family protein [Aspergillus cavernicola]|uniref:Mg2+ transporter MgtC family protein n=1 Tax=Aspergillus cavernicola TaxID=176166 RepID=A0ABR4IK10_9EURO
MSNQFDQDQGQTWSQVGQLLVAAGLSSTIGTEREFHHKSAGLRTNTLVGIGAALFMLISKFGTLDVLNRSLVVLDPSRIAAQIVSGIGFIGGGIIFKQRNEIRGLTTAAAVWLSAAVGAACGAGLLRLAAMSTLLYFIAVLVYPTFWRFLQQRLNLQTAMEVSTVVRYRDRSNGLQALLQTLMRTGFHVRSVTRLEEVAMDQTESRSSAAEDQQQSMSNLGRTQSELPRDVGKQSRTFDVHLKVDGPKTANDLIHALSQLDCVISISIADDQVVEVQEEHVSV